MLNAIHMDKREDEVIFDIVGLTKCSKVYKPTQPIIFIFFLKLSPYFVK